MKFEGSVIRLDPDKRGVWVKLTESPDKRLIARARVGQDGAQGLMAIIEQLKERTLVMGTVDFGDFEFPRINSISLK